MASGTQLQLAGRAGDRRSIISLGKDHGGSLGTVPAAPSSSVTIPTLASPATNQSIGSISMAPTTNPQLSTAGQYSPSSRAVSFVHPEKSSMTATTTSSHQYFDDKTRKRRVLLNKLQFWKKGGEEMDDIHEEKNSIGNTISISTSSEGNDRSSDEKRLNGNSANG